MRQGKSEVPTGEQTPRFISIATIIHAIGAYFNDEELPSCCQRVRD